MPFYRHHADHDPETGTPFATAGDAHAHRLSDETDDRRAKVTFVEGYDEGAEWRYRERQRFNTGEYVPAPFWEIHQTQDHFCHLSIKQPGMIAYTKSPEHGVQDRQTIMRPGRYLETFYKDGDRRLYEDLWPDWIAACSASAVTLSIATTADDIVSVYHGGPSSCMDSRYFPNRDDNPTKAYGNSDLAVAYLGDMDHATARAVIWPAKKRYGRMYGNEAVLKKLLDAEGYEYGHFTGARIQAIEDGGRYVCPWIDGTACRVTFVSDGHGKQWLELSPRGDLDGQNQDGYAGRRRDLCSHCQYADAEDDSPYCYDCEQERRVCDRCNEDHWDGGDYCDSCAQYMTRCDHCEELVDDDDARTVDEPSVTLCQSCYETHVNDCAVCNQTTIAHSLMRRTVRQQRDANGTARLCTSCIDDGYRLCPDCHEHTDHSEHDQCPDCYEPDAETDETQTDDPTTEPETTTCPDAEPVTL